ncbi:MAG: tetratricopeptide repeat protein [Anaerolineae bacterium]
MTSLYPTQLPQTFGEALRLLRKRARLTQDEMGRAVGYSREQIARLENGSRLPDLAVIAALFVPALFERGESALTEQFLALAGQSRQTQQITITRTRQTRVELISEAALHPHKAAHRPPAALLPLIGRDEELAGLLVILSKNRLVTLLGAPGIGKTRLALALAEHAVPLFSDGAAFIPLAEAATPDDVPVAVVRALGLTPHVGQSPADAVGAYVASRRLLLVLDNCEHVLEAAPLFADWLAAAPGLTLLCTSRVPLDLYGEQEWPLAPLATPDLASHPDLAGWGQSPALRLLLARVRAADPGFSLNQENLLPLATLCAALDGLPLALELAAVRLRELTPAEMAQQLLTLRGNAQLSSTWLSQTKRNVAERHRTLHAAIDWSVQRLPEAAQRALHQLGVFVGGCTEDAAQAVAGAGASTLAELARANLLAHREARITLLETLRAYALEHLAAQEALPAAQEQHARYFATWAQTQLFGGLLGDEQAVWMQRGLAEHSNCLAALRWALAQHDGELAIALSSSLWWFWYRRGLFDLATELLEAALALSTPQLADRARALNGLASIHLAQDRHAASLRCHEEGLALRRQLNDALGIATALHNMGLTAYMMGDYQQAIAWMHDSVAADPTADPTQAWAHIGIISLDILDLPTAHTWLHRAWALAEPQGGWIAAFVQYNLANLLFEMEDWEQAQVLAAASWQHFTALGDEHYVPDPVFLLGKLALQRGDLTLAQTLLDEALTAYQAQGDAILIASARQWLAGCALRAGNAAEAAAHRAAADAAWAAATRPLTPRQQAQRAQGA